MLNVKISKMLNVKMFRERSENVEYDHDVGRQLSSARNTETVAKFREIVVTDLT
jgi:hypothetical protein